MLLKVLAFAMVIFITSAAPVEDKLDSHWDLYKATYTKSYCSKMENSVRQNIWKENLKKIAAHNIEADLKQHSFKLGLNHLADLTDEEYHMLNGYRKTTMVKSSNRTMFMPPLNVEFPKEVDWREKGYVTDVKNQGQCGSCWAFSCTGSLEGQHKRKSGSLPSLSEQNLVDCASAEGNNGCDGGNVDFAFEYIRKNRGIDTEQSYPYKAKEELCHFKRDKIGATVTGFVDVPPFNEQILMKAVASVGPISVAIDASQKTFQLYSSGIYDEPLCSPMNLDHGVLVVGYGTEMDMDYWIVKNSWGPEWGEGGYIRMVRNKNNRCGIASAPSFPLV